MRIPIFGTEASVPSVCGGLELIDIKVYPESRLGVSMRYQNSSSIRADTYLYNFGLPSIPEDLRSPEVIQFYQGACQDVYATAKMGQYLELQTLTSQYLHIPPDAPEPFCLWAAFTYRQAPGPKVFYTGFQTSHLALRIDHGLINKVRYSSPEKEGMDKAGFKGFLMFLMDWTRAVQEYYTSG